MMASERALGYYVLVQGTNWGGGNTRIPTNKKGTSSRNKHLEIPVRENKWESTRTPG